MHARARNQRHDHAIVVVMLDSEKAFTSASVTGSTAGPDNRMEDIVLFRASGLTGAVMRRPALILTSLLSACATAAAIVGDAPPAEWTIARPTVMVYTPRGPCSGTVLAQDVVLTAAHCVSKAADYSIAGYIAARPFRLAGVAEVVQHPRYTPESGAEADIALVKLDKPLPTGFAPAFLDSRRVRVGERLLVVGYGTTNDGGAMTGGIPRMAMLSVKSSNNYQFTMTDQHSNRLGGCGGDSGASVFAMRGGVPALAGVVSRGSCGISTIATAFAGHRSWTIETAKGLGSPID